MRWAIHGRREPVARQTLTVVDGGGRGIDALQHRSSRHAPPLTGHGGTVPADHLDEEEAARVGRALYTGSRSSHVLVRILAAFGAHGCGGRVAKVAGRAQFAPQRLPAHVHVGTRGTRQARIGGRVKVVARLAN